MLTDAFTGTLENPMRHSTLFALAVLSVFSRCGYGEPFEFRPPEDAPPVNTSLVQYVTVQIDGGDEATMVCGKTYKLTGEIQLAEGVGELDLGVARLLAHHEQAPGGVIMQEAPAEITLIEGSRYAFSSDFDLPDYKVGGEVELQIIAHVPGKGESNAIYRQTITVLTAPE
jgi:hypothetical protein